MIIVALAGPGMNLALGLIAAFALAIAIGMVGEVTLLTGFLVANIENFLVINVFLALFNLLPLPPFDGGHVIEGLLPRRLSVRYRRLGRFGFPLLILLLVVLPMVAPQANIVERVVVPPVRFVIGLFLAIAGVG